MGREKSMYSSIKSFSPEELTEISLTLLSTEGKTSFKCYYLPLRVWEGYILINSVPGLRGM